VLSESALAIDRTPLPIPATIVVIGERTPDVLRTVQALEPFGHVRLVAGDEAAGVLAQFDPEIVIVDDRQLNHLDLVDALPGAPHAPVRILLSARPTEVDSQAGTAVLPKPVDPNVARAV